MSKSFDLPALRSEFPGATDARLAVIADFRDRVLPLPAAAKRTGEAVMRLTMALEFSARPAVAGDPNIVTVSIDAVASGLGIAGEVNWTDGKFESAWFNAGGATADVIVRSAADFVKRLEKAVADRRGVTETVDAPAAAQDTPQDTTDTQDTVTPVTDTTVIVPAVMAEGPAGVMLAEIPVPIPDPVPVKAVPVGKGNTDRVARALAAAQEKVSARGADPVDDSEEAAQDARDRVAAQLAVLAGVSEPTATMPTSGAVPVVDVPAIVRAVRDVPTPGDLAIALAERLETSHKHFSALMSKPATLGDSRVRTRVANAITKELGELRMLAADIDGTGQFKITGVSSEITQLGEWVFEILRAYRFLLINNSHKITSMRVKNVKAKIRKRVAHVRTPEFRAELTARLLSERATASQD